MKWISNVLIYGGVLLAMVLLSFGCMEDFWPTTQISEPAIEYVGGDPNDYRLPVTTLGEVKRVRQKATGIYLLDQIRLQAELDKNEAMNALVMGEVDMIIKRAQEQYESAVGSIDKPGWLMLALLGGGGGMLGRKLTTLTHYSEAEYQQGIEKAKNGTTAGSVPGENQHPTNTIS